MRHRLVLRLLAALLALTPTTAVAQEKGPQATAPEALTREYFHALRDRGLGSTADFLHPDELARYKETMLPLFEAEAAAGESALRRTVFGPDTSIEEVREVPPARFLRTFLEEVARQSGEPIRFEELKVIGSLPEGEDLVHVLVRFRLGSGEVGATSLEVVSFRRYEETWRMLLTGELEGFARAVRRMGGAGLPPPEAPR